MIVVLLNFPVIVTLYINLGAKVHKSWELEVRRQENLKNLKKLTMEIYGDIRRYKEI